MLTVGSSAVVTARISMFRILAAPHFCGAFLFDTHLLRFPHESVAGAPKKQGTCYALPPKT